MTPFRPLLYVSIGIREASQQLTSKCLKDFPINLQDEMVYTTVEFKFIHMVKTPNLSPFPLSLGKFQKDSHTSLMAASEALLGIFMLSMQ